MFLSPIFRLHIIVFLWGFTAILGKLISFESIYLVWYRVLIAVLVLFIIAYIKKDIFKVSKKLILSLLACGIIISVHWYLFFLSIKVSNVSIALATISTGALFTALLEPIFFKRKIKGYEIFLSLIITICMAFIFNAEIKYYKGIILGLLCSFLSVLFSVINAKLLGKTSSLNMIFYELLGGFIFLTFLVFLFFEPIKLTYISNNDFIYLMILGSIFTAYPMLESTRLLHHITPYTLFLTLNLEPIYGIVLAHFFFKDSESMTPIFYFSTIIMLLSIILNGIWKNSKK